MKLLIGIPAYQRTVYTDTLVSLYVDRCKYPSGICKVDGNPYITRARNDIAKIFLDETNCDALLFVDHDISWDAHEKYIDRLIDSEKPVAAGVYPRRDPREIDFPVILLDKPKIEGEWMTLAKIPLGFTLIRRYVFENMMGFYDRKFLFHETPDIGEDFLFCQEWLAMDGEVWIDTSMLIRHHEAGLVYSRDFRSWLKERAIDGGEASPVNSRSKGVNL